MEENEIVRTLAYGTILREITMRGYRIKPKDVDIEVLNDRSYVIIFPTGERIERFLNEENPLEAVMITLLQKCFWEKMLRKMERERRSRSEETKEV